MPHSISAKKRVRQNEKRRDRNKGVRSETKTWVKKVRTAAASKNAADARASAMVAIRKIDKAAKKGVIKKNAAARKKSRLAKMLNKLPGANPTGPKASPTA